MKKILLLVFELFTCANIFSQNSHSFGQWVKDIGLGCDNPELEDSIGLKKAVNKNLYLSGIYLQKSASFQYYSIGCAAISGGLLFLGTKVQDINYNKQACYIFGSLFGVASLIHYFISVDYKLKAGKSIKLAASPTGGKISLIF